VSGSSNAVRGARRRLRKPRAAAVSRKERPRRRKGRLFARIYAVVRRVPCGRVASYGLIARLVGPGCGARTVGYALAATPEDVDLPWQRIVNREGRVSLPGPGGEIQRALLAAEGLVFDARDRIDMKSFGWTGAAARRPARRSRRY
jgi:methylated-DNA-protein-cysteine methyltransferase related protein